MSNCFILPIDSTLSGVTGPCQSGAGNNGIVGVLHIPQSSIVGTSLSDGLMSYQRISSGWRSYPSAGMQSMYSAVQAYWTGFVW